MRARGGSRRLGCPAPFAALLVPRRSVVGAVAAGECAPAAVPACMGDLFYRLRSRTFRRGTRWWHARVQKPRDRVRMMSLVCCVSVLVFFFRPGMEDRTHSTSCTGPRYAMSEGKVLWLSEMVSSKSRLCEGSPVGANHTTSCRASSASSATWRQPRCTHEGALVWLRGGDE